MDEQNKQTIESETQDDNNVDYIDAIKRLKENSVDRQEYDRLKADNRRLIDALANGQEIQQDNAVEKPNITELRKALFKRDNQLTNLEYCSKALELREALLESGEQDPFLPIGDKVSVTAEQVDKANQVAEVLKSCVEFAQGDSGIFTAELQRRTNDVVLPRKR